MQNIEDIFDLPPAQQGVLYQTLSGRTSGAYLEQICLSIQGNLNIQALRDAWREVSRQTPILRSTFHLQNLDKPIQVIHGNMQEQWSFHDWRELPSPERVARLQTLLEADRDLPFDLSTGPLVRLVLIQADTNEHHLVFTSHHVLLDGWSVALVLQRIFEAYWQVLTNHQVRLAPCPDLTDYLMWLKSRDLKAAESYWLHEFQDYTHVPLLYLSGPERSTSRTYGECECRLPREQCSAIELFAKRKQISLNAVVQGAWAAQLAARSGNREVVVGVTVSGRPAELANSELMIGMFINTVPLRLKIDPHAQLTAWIKQIHEQNIQLREHEYVPAVQIQGWVGLGPAVPMIESLLVYENYPTRDLLGPAPLSIQKVSFSGGRTHYPIVLIVVPGCELLLRVVYNRSRFQEEDVERILTDLSEFLSQIVDNEDSQIGRFMTRREPVVEWPPPQQKDTAEVKPQPQTATEQRLAHIWSELLGVEHVGVSDDFFDLGGHSLLAMQLLSRIRDAFGIELTILDLFTVTLTISELARLVECARHEALAATAVDISNGPQDSTE